MYALAGHSPTFLISYLYKDAMYRLSVLLQIDQLVRHVVTLVTWIPLVRIRLNKTVTQKNKFSEVHGAHTDA